MITVFNILVGIALLLAIVNLVTQKWPLLAVAVLLVCVAMLVHGNYK